MGRAKTSMALDDQLCFALYASSRAMIARYRPVLERIGLTYPQYLVMMVLWDEGAATVSQLGQRLRLDSGTLSPLLKRLETAGHITRSRRPEDERSVEIELSSQGRALRRQASSIPGEIAAALDGIDHEQLIGELQLLETALRKK